MCQMRRALEKFQRKVLEEGTESRLYIELRQKIELTALFKRKAEISTLNEYIVRFICLIRRTTSVTT